MLHVGMSKVDGAERDSTGNETLKPWLAHQWPRVGKTWTSLLTLRLYGDELELEFVDLLPRELCISIELIEHPDLLFGHRVRNRAWGCTAMVIDVFVIVSRHRLDKDGSFRRGHRR